MNERLIFVYNADSGLINMAKDYIHKAVSPQTYDCQLCAVTYGPLGMRQRWRKFVRGLNVEVEFLHRDELAERYGISGADLPAAWQVAATDTSPQLWLSAEQMRRVATLDELITLVESLR